MALIYRYAEALSVVSPSPFPNDVGIFLDTDTLSRG